MLIHIYFSIDCLISNTFNSCTKSQIRGKMSNQVNSNQVKSNLIRNKMKQYSKLRQVVTICCLVGCIFQCFELTEDYLSFETRLTTDIDMHYERNTSMPAITVCIDKIINYTKLEEDFPNIRRDMKKHNKSWSSLDPILEFSKVYKFLNRKIDNFNIIKSFNYSVDFGQLINYWYNGENFHQEGLNKILTYNMGDYCSTTFSLNSKNDPSFFESTMPARAKIILEVMQMTSIFIKYNSL